MYETIPQQLRTVEAQYTRLSKHTRSLIHQAARAIEDLVMQCHGNNAAINGMKREIERMVVIDADKDRAIEDLTRQRDRAHARLCEWCGVCPPDKRNPEDCEIAAIGPDYTSPEPPKKEV